MTDPTTDDLIDYEDEEELVVPPLAAAGAAATGQAVEEAKKGSYVGIHATGFRDFLLKPELLRAIVDCGFEHPSEGTTQFYSADSRRWSLKLLLALDTHLS